MPGDRPDLTPNARGERSAHRDRAPSDAARAAAQWLVWGAALVLLTAALHLVRQRIEQAHVALLYVLLVLAGSASGGRAIGLALAGASFLAIDYYFQSPYDTLAVSHSLDWLVLAVFLATATLGTHLLARLRAAVTRAEQRAAEVQWLARVGSETLSAGRAEDALGAIARAVRGTLHVDRCALYHLDGGTPALAAEDGTVAADVAADVAALDREALAWAARHDRSAAVRDGVVVPGPAVAAEVVPDDATPDEGDAAGPIVPPGARALFLPLHAHGAPVGVLGIACRTPFAFDDARRRVLGALAYYAALALERVRLVAAAEHAAALREADRLKDDLLLSVSHDLRTPLTAIRAIAEDAVARGDEGARAVLEQTERLTHYVGGLLDLSRLRSGHVPVAVQVQAAEDVLGTAVRQLEARCPAHPLVNRMDFAGEVLLGRFDFVQTLRVLSNLIENACRYAPPGTPVELGAERRGNRLRFTVADRGPGVAPDERERIFEPFYRAPGSRPDVGGTGLGLAIARQLAVAQGGTLTYEARPDGGSRFVLELPAVEPEAGAATTP